jgi:RNA polymerase sigma-B factor
MQVASLGLIRAVEAFDPSRAVSFSSFAVPYIRGQLSMLWEFPLLLLQVDDMWAVASSEPMKA